jgi:hypothetical protein
MKEYLRSGKGCADLIATHYEKCVFARKRFRQLWIFYGLTAALIVALSFTPLATLALGVGASIIMVLAVLIKVRRLEAVAYPFISLLLGTMFVAGLTKRLAIREALAEPVLHELGFVAHELTGRAIGSMIPSSAPAEAV